MVSCGCNFGFRSLQHLLIAAVNELGNFSADEVSRIGKYLDAIVAILLDRCRDIVLFQEHAPLHAGSFNQIKSMVAKPLHGVIKCSLFYFGCHVIPCRWSSVVGRWSLPKLKLLT